MSASNPQLIFADALEDRVQRLEALIDLVGRLEATTGVAGLLSASDKGNLALLLDPPRWRAYNTVAQGVANTTLTRLTFNATRWNTRGAAAGTGGLFASDIWTVPPNGAGMYEIGAQVRWATSAAGVLRRLVLRVNGATIIDDDDRGGSPGAGSAPTNRVVTRYQLAVADTVEVLAYQDTGGALNTFIEAADSPEFWGSWVHP